MKRRPTDKKPPTLNARGLKFAIIVSRYNSFATEPMLEGAMDALMQAGARIVDQEIIWAPGAYEIPVLAKAALRRGGFDGVITLGCVMKGQTIHNELIASEVAGGLALVALEFVSAVAFGVLTPNTRKQAMERADPRKGNKGGEAANAAIETALAIRKLAKAGKK